MGLGLTRPRPKPAEVQATSPHPTNLSLTVGPEHYGGVSIDQLGEVPIYAHAKLVVDGGGVPEAYEINYITFYAFNGHYHLPANVPLFKTGHHVGDWEHLTVRLDATTLELQGVWYNAHRNIEGEWCPAEAVPRTPCGRIVGYVAINGHGVYPHCGTIPRLFFVANDRTSRRGPVWSPNRLMRLCGLAHGSGCPVVRSRGCSLPSRPRTPHPTCSSPLAAGAKPQTAAAAAMTAATAGAGSESAARQPGKAETLGRAIDPDPDCGAPVIAGQANGNAPEPMTFEVSRTSEGTAPSPEYNTPAPASEAAPPGSDPAEADGTAVAAEAAASSEASEAVEAAEGRSGASVTAAPSATTNASCGETVDHPGSVPPPVKLRASSAPASAALYPSAAPVAQGAAAPAPGAAAAPALEPAYAEQAGPVEGQGGEAATGASELGAAGWPGGGDGGAFAGCGRGDARTEPHLADRRGYPLPKVVHDTSPWQCYRGFWGSVVSATEQGWFLGPEPPVSRGCMRRLFLPFARGVERLEPRRAAAPPSALRKLIARMVG